MKRSLLLLAALSIALPSPASAKTPDGRRKLVFVAGKPSHPPRMHEFNAGVQLLTKCLVQGAPKLQVDVVLNGWPADEKIFDGADAVVFYMDGGPKHEVVQDGGARIAKVEEWVRNGVGIGCMHYGVEVEVEPAGEPFRRWIGGHYEKEFSCNPMWEPSFEKFPTHPVTSGVQPFQIKDEWYMNIRFANGFTADGAKEDGGVKFVPILVAKPSDEVRKGPYVYPKGPYDHIVAASGRNEAMMWTVERADGGRGFGFTGGHYHDNWANDDFRKTVLNALVWVAKGEVPAAGIASTVSKGDLDANLDSKPEPKKK